MQKYSVLMTVYGKDNPAYFSLALHSMLVQTYPADEIIIVKDGPIPAPLQQVIDEALTDGAPIVPVELLQNQGLGLALNAGLGVAKNELIARMDADDYSLPQRCEKQVKEFEKNPQLDIVGCPVLEFVGDIHHIVGKREVPLTNSQIYAFAKRRDPFNHPTVMYRRSAVLKAGGYSSYRKNQDTDLWIKMLSQRATCLNLAEPLVYFRFDKNTYQKRKSWLNTKILLQIRYRAWKSGFNSLGDFLLVAGAQLGIYIMPTWIQENIYRKLLRN